MDLETELRDMIDAVYDMERERNAMYSEGYNHALDHVLEFLDGFNKRYPQQSASNVAKERQQCAILCEQLGMEGFGSLAIAAAIRARI